VAKPKCYSFVASSPDPEVPAKPERRNSATGQTRIMERDGSSRGARRVGAIFRGKGFIVDLQAAQGRDAAVRKALFGRSGDHKPNENPLSQPKMKRLRGQNQRLQESWEKGAHHHRR